MSKKRPKTARLRPKGLPPAVSKYDAGYWQARLFKCRYIYRGKRLEVRHWSVKIQHLGKRKTFSLQSSRRSQAAAEACELYRTLLRQGWRAVIPQGDSPTVPAYPRLGAPALPADEKRHVGYWAQRLIHREYTMRLDPTASQELSVRIDAGGTGYYFPLETSNRPLAAKRASRIYQAIVDKGWEAANKRFSRELTVALCWLDVPLAWTYTTIRTLVPASRSKPLDTRTGGAGAFEVAIAESDAGIRHALEWCVNHMDGFRCVASFASVAEAFEELARRPVHLTLISHSLADKPGTVCLAELKVAVPDACCLLYYSVYEDSEELFRATPGGAGIYLLRRTPPTEFLEPVAGRLRQRSLLGEEMAPAVWQYFKDSVSSMPIGSAARQLANLTQRELEVLALLSKGHSDKEIADQLDISIHTVHEHVRNIFEKLGAHNRTEAVVKFLQK